ncbi:hypothetical protein Micbo1qcDRAFT_170745 [Microdochium bolleyi]|uniref:Myb-like DNA-binding domain-containing protein n=1 Tax=Microdochium bolleyi TaxID=196109 RepID=A0A136JIL5_9PEZI|nr:hypothetical protein Micbo1qcDRAFT_170745 [Microdochium bolleyi]
MAGPTDHEGTVKFLIACIRHSVNGKINWQGVADDCGLNTKGAANMRYSRLLKSHGVNPGGGSGTDSAPASPRKTPSKPKTPRKKGAKGEDDDTADEVSPTKKRKTVKAEEADGGVGGDGLDGHTAADLKTEAEV